MRQIDDVVHAGRHLRADRRRFEIRRPHRQPGRGQGPQRRNRLPVLCPLSPYDRPRQHPVSPEIQESGEGRGAYPGRGRSAPGSCRRTARPPPEPTVRRPAAARGPGPGPGQVAATAASRRAAIEPGCHAAPLHAYRNPGPAAAHRGDNDPRHPRPDRGDDHGRSHHLHVQGTGRAGGDS